MNFEDARRIMVESQLRPNRVTNEAVLAAMRTLPREQFVPETQRPVAYVDKDLVIAPGRCIMEPLILARLVQAAAPPHVVPFCSSYSKISYLTLKKCGEYGRSTVATKTHGGFSSTKHDLARSVRVFLNSFCVETAKTQQKQTEIPEFENLHFFQIWSRYVPM